MNREQAEHIEKYFNNELSAEEREVFEYKRSVNPDFAKEVETHKIVHELLIDQGLIELKQKMKAGNYGNSSGKNWKPYAFSAGILLLASIGTYYYFAGKDTTVITSEQLPVEIKEQSSSIVNSDKQIETEEKEPAKIYPEQIEKPETQSVTTDNSDVEKEPVKDSVVVSLPVKDNMVNQTPVATGESTSLPVIAKKANKPDVEPRTIITIESDNNPVKPKSTQHEYQFNPTYGQVWQLPIEPGDNAELKILNKSGIIIYQLVIINGYPNTWDGMLKSGGEAPMESYVYFITHTSGKVEQGYVTVFR